MANLLYRGRHVNNIFLPTQLDQLVPWFRRQRLLLVYLRLVWPSHHLPLGHRHQHSLFVHPWYLRLCPSKQRDKLRTSHSRCYHLVCLCRYPRTHLLFNHLRDVCRAPPRAEHRCWSRRVLRGRDPHDLSGFAATQHYRMERCRQVWFRLGKHRHCLLDLGLLRSARDEAPFIP